MRTHPKRIAITIILGLAAISTFGFLLSKAQSYLVERNMQQEMIENSEYIKSAVAVNSHAGENVRRWFFGLHKAYLLMLNKMINEDPSLIESDQFYRDMNAMMETQDLMLIDREGNIVKSASGSVHDLKEERYKPLLDSFDSGEVIELTIRKGEDPESSPSSEKTELEAEADGGPQDEKGIEAEADSVMQDAEGLEAAENVVAQAAEVKIEETDQEEKTATGDTVYIEEDEVEKSNENPVYYSMSIDKRNALVINEFGGVQQIYEYVMDPWTYVLENEVIGSDGYAFAWNADTGKILYYPRPDVDTVDDLGMDLSSLKEGTFSEGQLFGTDMLFYSAFLEEERAWIVCAVPVDELHDSRAVTNLLLWLFFGLLAVAVIYYSCLLLRPHESENRLTFVPAMKRRPRHTRRRKLLIFTVLCTTAIFLTSFYLQTLYLMSRWASDSTAFLQSVEQGLDFNSAFRDSFQEDYDRGQSNLVRMAGWYLDRYPEKQTTECFDELCKLLSFNVLFMTDDTSAIKAASSSYVMKEDAEVTAASNQDAQSEEKTAPEKIMFDATLRTVVPVRNMDSIINGYLWAEYTSLQRDVILAARSFKNTLKSMQPGEGGFVFAVDKNSGTISYYEEEMYLDKKAMDYGLKETDLQTHLCNFIRFIGKDCYTVSGESGDNYIYVAIESERLLSRRLPVSAAATLVAFVLLLLIGLPVYTCAEEKDDSEEVPEERDRSSRKSDEEKVYRVILTGLAVFAACFVVYYWLFRERGSRADVLSYVLSGSWEYGINVFALTASLIAAAQGGLVLFLIRRVAALMNGMLPVRGGTILRMLTSLITYLGVMLIGYQCLVNFGMSPTVMMTSAGIVSVVIGIGANSLVGDVIAGIFLLMEGNVQVGDMITVDGFRGCVEELGIRVTRIYDVDSEDVKIIANKDVQNVQHMTAHPANLYLEYMCEYGVDLERLEELLRRELETLRSKVPQLIDDPEYLGVRRLDSDGIVLLVRARCYEAYRPYVTRAVNRAVYMLFARTGFSVPFPQVTLHNAYPEDGNR